MPLSRFDEFLVEKTPGARTLIVLPGAQVSVYKPGATISALDAGSGLTYRVYSTADILAGDVLEINGATTTVLTVPNSTTFTANATVTREPGDRCLRTNAPAVLYLDSVGGTVITQPATADDDGRFEFYIDQAVTPRYDLKAVTALITLVKADIPAIGPTDTLNVTTLFTAADARFAGRPWFDVTHPTFGALGDGVNDDTLEIQAAIDAADAAGGGIVFFPEGTYILSNQANACCLTLSNRDNVTLMGVGASSILKLADSQTSFTRMISCGVPAGAALTVGLRIRDLKLDGNKANQVAATQQYSIFLANCQNVRIENVWCESPFAAGIYLFRNSTPTPDAVGVDDVVVDRCSVLNAGAQGILFTGATNCKITNNTIYNSAGTAIKNEDSSLCYGITIANNTIDACAAGILAQGDESPSYLIENVAIRGNTIRAMQQTASDSVGIAFQHGRGCVIANNVIEDPYNRGILIFGDARDVVIANNVVRGLTVDVASFNNRRASIAVYSSGARAVPQDVTITGNIVEGGLGWGLAVMGISTGTPTQEAFRVVATGNLFLNNFDREVMAFLVQNFTFSNNIVIQDGDHYWFYSTETGSTGNNLDFFIKDNQFINSTGDADTPTRNPIYIEVPGSGATALTGLVLTGNHFPELKAHLNDITMVDGTIVYHSNVGGTAVAFGTLPVHNDIAIGRDLSIVRNVTTNLPVLGSISKLGAFGETTVLQSVSELLTLSLAGTTTDTVANLLPADAVIEAVVARVTTAVTGAGVTSLTLGDPTTANRFALLLGLTTAPPSTIVGLRHRQGGIATDAAGPVQPAAAKVRVTAVGGTPTAGIVRITVFYRQFTAPTS